MTALRACLYLRDLQTGGDLARAQEQGIDWCTRQGYDLASVIIDNPDGDRWQTVFRLLLDGLADVIVVVRRNHIPVSVPRIEVVEDARRQLDGGTAFGRPSSRRPQLLR
ncbi:hypothetical protein [Micromonospora sp. NBC_01813]|uniref:hypothetical protein n=1 Tax=Micromonospora sp. NBC_01813 TaxID=2975988 RepID=UPI002DDB7DD4|nr:hypothetical protein [Micromonospora sp. NBC_01813]WSA07085.1 hypothetical protein OG958_22855 [Micromonospora sp. NBC_01813]